MGEGGLVAECVAAGFHGVPGTWDSEERSWRGWAMHPGVIRAVPERWNPGAEVWITWAGHSIWRNDVGPTSDGHGTFSDGGRT